MPKPNKATQTAADGLDVGDVVYAKHPQKGAVAVTVKAVGAHGFTADDETGARHKLHHETYLGHKTRMLHTYELVDQGADGVLVENQQGRRRFLRGELPKEKEGSDNGGMNGSDAGDPLLGGLDLMTKALTPPRPLPPFPDLLFFKAGSIARRPGLMLQDRTDRTGRHQKKWVRTQKDQPHPRERKGQEDEPKPRQKAADKPEPTRHKHGDEVTFTHDNIEGRGVIVASGKDGATIRDASGREHQVRHEAIEPPPQYEARNEGEDDKAYAKRSIDKMPSPKHVPEQHDRFFNMDKATATIPLDKLVSTKSDAENKQGGDNAPKRLMAAYHGKVAKRDPITVRPTGDGKYEVVDGNGTFTAAKAAGWKAIPVQQEGGAKAGGEQGPLFDETDVAHLPPPPAEAIGQPVKTEAEIFEKAQEAQKQLEEWLDLGKGVAAKLGFERAKGSPDDEGALDGTGGKLFIAPIKSAKRSAEKVRDDYAGDWSKLLDPVRCSFACDTFDDVRRTLVALKQSGMKLHRKPKDRFAKPTDEGYRDCMLNVVLPNGLVGEVQVHVKEMLKAKAEGHKWYEIQRELDGKAQTGDLSTEEQSKRLASVEAQRQIYGAAWKKATGKNQEGQMAKALNITGKTYTYYEKDNAYFRRLERPGGHDAASIDDVLHGDKWVPYKGDRLAPVVFGDRVDDPLGSDSGEEKPDAAGAAS
jgi:hypothetical protein